MRKIENLGTLLDSLEKDESDAREAEAQFYTTLSNNYPVDAHTGFADVTILPPSREGWMASLSL